MSADVSHLQRVETESMILSVVAAEAILRYAIAPIPAALLPAAVFSLPAISAIIPPRGLLLVHAGRTALLCRPVLLLLPIPLSLVLRTPALSSLIRGIFLPLPALLLLILLHSRLLLPLICRVILSLLILLPAGLLLLLPGRIVLPVLLRLPLMVLLLPGHLLLLLLCIVLLLLSSCLLMILFYGFRILLMLFGRPVLVMQFFLFFVLFVRILA